MLGVSRIAGPSMRIIARYWDDDGFSEVFLCSGAPRFGLRNTKEAPKVKVPWPREKTESFAIDPINFELTCIEGRGTIVP